MNRTRSSFAWSAVSLTASLLLGCSNPGVAPAQHDQPLSSCFVPTSGPTNARVNALAASGDRVLAATEQGLFQRIGGQWRPVPGAPSMAITGLGARGSEIFLASSAGVFYSADGTAWTAALDHGVSSALFAFDETHAAATFDFQLHEWNAALRTWAPSELPSDGTLACSTIDAITYADGRIYLVGAFSPGLFSRAADGGAWTHEDVGDPEAFGSGCTALTSVGSTLYAVCQSRLYVRDAAGAWSARADLGEEGYDLQVHDGAIFVRRALGYYRSTDGGDHFTMVAPSEAISTTPLGGMVTASGALFVVGKGAVTYSADGGDAWAAEPIRASTVRALAFADKGPGLCVTTDVGSIDPTHLPTFLSSDEGASFSKLAPHEQVAVAAGALFTLDADGRLVNEATHLAGMVPSSLERGQNKMHLLGTAQALFVSGLEWTGETCDLSYDLLGLPVPRLAFYRSLDGGQTWDDLTDNLGASRPKCGSSAEYAEVAELSDLGGGALIAVSYALGSYLSLDAGATWKALPTLGKQKAQIMRGALTGATLFFGTFDGLWTSTDAALHVAPVPAFAGKPISALVTDGSLLAVAVGGDYSVLDQGGVWTSIDHGKSFQTLDAKLHEPVNALALTSRHLYAGLRAGVFKAALDGCER